MVRTIKGNTNGGAVVANGVGVHVKEYVLNNPKIDGYGHPDYNLVGGGADDKYQDGYRNQTAGGIT